MTCGYGPFDYGKCECTVTIPTGILDFFLDTTANPVTNPNEYFTRFGGSVSFTNEPNEGQRDGSGRLKWGMKYRDNLKITTFDPSGSSGFQRLLAAWSGDRVIRHETWTLSSFVDNFTIGSGSLSSHTPNVDTHGTGWVENLGSWSSTSGVLTLDSTGNGIATTDYRFADTVTFGAVKVASDDVEAGILARGNATKDGSIRLHYSKAANEAELFIYGSSVEVLDFAAEAPDLVSLTISAIGRNVFATALGSSGGVATGPTKTTAVYDDSSYNFKTSPTLYGVYGEKATDQDCKFDAIANGIVFQVGMSNLERISLYEIGLASSDIDMLCAIDRPSGTVNVITPNVVRATAFPSTLIFKFLEDNGSVTTVTTVDNDPATHPVSGLPTTERHLGITAGWAPTNRDFRYGLGVKIDGADWRLVGGSVSFPSGNGRPIVNESDEVDKVTLAVAVPDLTGLSVAYQSMHDGSVVAGTWAKSFGAEQFTRKFVSIDGNLHLYTETIQGSVVIAPGCVAMVVNLGGGDKEFRIYNSGGIVYSNSHATRWDDATVICASDRWFYVVNVRDWSGYYNVEPSVVHGSPPTYISLLISMDGSERVRICQYSENPSELRYYDARTTGVPADIEGMPITGSPPSTGLRPSVDCVKISDSVGYALPSTISYPAP